VTGALPAADRPVQKTPAVALQAHAQAYQLATATAPAAAYIGQFPISITGLINERQLPKHNSLN
jgi:hypothetical protein